MSTIIAKNNTGSNIFIEDLGVTVPASSSINLTEIFDIIRVLQSDNLKTEVNDEDITINDGTYDLPTIEGLKHITIQTEYEDIYYGESGWYIGPTPPDNPVDGKGWYDSTANILFVFDETRSKWLSINRIIITFQKSGSVTSQYLNIGDLALSSSGYLVPRKGTIISCSIRATAGDDDCSFDIRDNGGQILQKSFVNSYELYDSSLNTDFNSTAILQCYCMDTSENPIVIIELAWRY
jgi:hypothetical protein